jgi:hypothetical protein
MTETAALRGVRAEREWIPVALGWLALALVMAFIGVLMVVL